MNEFRLGGAAVIVAITLACALAAGRAQAERVSPPPNASQVEVAFNIRVPMRDGAELSADVYQPAAPGRYPVIVARTPYNKSPAWDRRGRWWAQRGYVFVVQDVRGRGDSDGKFYPLVNEAADGIDTYDWAANQTWSSGEVAGFGGSYGAWTQLYPAAKGSRSLTAMLLMAVPPDPDRAFPYSSGGAAIPATAAWLASLDGRMYQSLDNIDLEAAYSGRPLIDMDLRLGRKMPVWRDWIAAGPSRAYWANLSYQSALLNSVTPGLWITGWYDDVLAGATENFTAMTSEARDSQARTRHWLVIGPWGHAINADRKLGDIDFGPDAVIDLDDLQRRWFDYWLKGADNGFNKEPRVKLFVMGSNQWISEDEWPIARTRYVPYYLRGEGGANTLNGDGRLSTEAPPPDEAADRYRFDPENPVPYANGLDAKQMGGPDDYRKLELRSDVLVYTTAAFTQNQRVCGPLQVALFASSSARDTDWTAKLLVVHPSGYAQRLNDGIIRARYRHGTDSESLLTPGKPEEYRIDLWATCLDVLPGYRLRLEISSSAAGKYDVNLNTGGDQAREKSSVVAEQTVHHNALRPSHILLPFVSPKDE